MPRRVAWLSLSGGEAVAPAGATKVPPSCCDSEPPAPAPDPISAGGGGGGAAGWPGADATTVTRTEACSTLVESHGALAHTVSASRRDRDCCVQRVGMAGPYL